MAIQWPGGSLLPAANSNLKLASGALAVGINKPGVTSCLEVFAVNAGDGSVWHTFQGQPNGAAGWSDWMQLTANPAGVSFMPAPAELMTPTTLAVATNQFGLLEVFAIGSDGYPYHNYQDPTQPSYWSGWVRMARPVLTPRSLALANVGGLLVVVYFTVSSQDLQAPAFYDFQIVPPAGPMNVWNSQANGGTVQEIPGPQVSFPPVPFDVGTLLSSGWLVAVGLPGRNGGAPTYWVNQLGPAAGPWLGWKQLPTPASPFVGLLNTFIAPAAGWLVNGGFPAVFNVDQFGNLAGSQYYPGAGAEWGKFIAYGGPALGQLQLQTGLVAVGVLPEAINNTGAGGFSELDTQYVLAFAVDSATGTSVWGFPILCDNENNLDQQAELIQCNPTVGTISALAVGVNLDTHLEVFALDSLNQCSHWWQPAPGSSPY
jgi:hypothetical protein